MKALSVGDLAPSFTLKATDGQEISLEQFRGYPVILIFYPADFSPVCQSQLVIYNEMTAIFDQYKAILLPISVDSLYCHANFKQQSNFVFPLLSDFEPKGEVARLYGVYDKKNGFCERAIFVIDEAGIIIWRCLFPFEVNPGAKEILNALEMLYSKKET